MGKICTDTLSSCFMGRGGGGGGVGRGKGSGEICGKYVLRRFQAVYGADYNETWKI